MNQINAIRRLPAVLAVVGLSRSTLYLQIAQGLWPKPVRISGRSVGWLEGDIQSVLAARIAGWPDANIEILVSELEHGRLSTAISATKEQL